jgi:hypothetical protein
MKSTSKTTSKVATHKQRSAIAKKAAAAAWATMRSKAYLADTSKGHEKFFASR